MALQMHLKNINILSEPSIIRGIIIRGSYDKVTGDGNKKYIYECITPFNISNADLI